MYKKLSQLGRALMLPISILPCAGLLLGLGSALTSQNSLAMFPFLNNDVVIAILTIMKIAGGVVFDNIALLFAMGIAVGLAKESKGTAGIAGGIAYLIFTAVMNGCGKLEVFNVQDIKMDTGVLGAMVIGITVSILHNKFHKVQLPDAVAFFGGNRFVPLISSLTAIVLGFIFFLIWPSVSIGLSYASSAIAGLGAFGSFLYGSLMRLLGAVGLHHAVYPMFWYTELGGVEQVAGNTVIGAQNIYFAQMADPNHVGLYTYGTRFFAGRFATIMCGVPAAALAMYLAIPKRNRKKYKGLYLSGGITSFVTGVTEPIEYSFLFVAPWLYIIHCILDGFAFLVMDLLNVRIGNAFSGGFLEFSIFGIFQGNEKTNWIICLCVGLAWAVLYFVIFYSLIKIFRVPIPGMVDNKKESLAEIVKTKGDKQEQLNASAKIIIEALGGKTNIETISACATRLRVSVVDSKIINKDLIKEQGAMAIIEKSGGIQAVFGPKAEVLSTEINSILKKIE